MVDNFREYLRFPTVQPDPDYGPAVDFLTGLGNELGLEATCLELFPAKPILILKWPGKNSSLESILLNSHMDVVPVYPEKWNHDPFGAEMDEAGNIYARGSQDMKCVTIQYFAAIKNLQTRGFVPLRNIFLSIVPDEEIGGILGMAALVESDFFRALNVGFALDEGIASPTEVFSVFYGERTLMPFRLTCHGNPGHGSLFLTESAGERFNSCLSSIYEFRRREERKLVEDSSLSLGDVTTTNLTIVNGGVQTNVVPATITACFDLRLTPSLAFEEFCAQVLPGADGENVIVEPHFFSREIPPSSLDSPFCQAFFAACEEIGIQTKNLIFPAGTDGRYLRGMGIPVLGFSPMNNTPVLLHDNDEYLNVDVFMRGIDIYCKIIEAISS